MNIDLVLDVCNEIDASKGIGFIKDLVNRLGKMPWNNAKKFLKQKALEFEALIKDDPYIDDRRVLAIINNRLGTHFTDIHSIVNKGLFERVEKCDEGLKDWWKEASSNLYNSLAFYPLLTVFMELDKIIKDSGDANVRTMLIYFLIWVLVISGKIIAGKIGSPGQEKEAGAVINPKSWAEIANRARVNA